MKALYEVVNGYTYGRLTKEGEKVWKLFTETVKDVMTLPLFEDADIGELADTFSKEFPRLNKTDIYNYLLSYGD